MTELIIGLLAYLILVGWICWLNSKTEVSIMRADKQAWKVGPSFTDYLKDDKETDAAIEEAIQDSREQGRKKGGDDAT